MYLLNFKAIKSLNAILHLPSKGNEQDWEIELADPKRVPDFLNLLEQGGLSNDENVALFALLLASLEEGASLGLTDKDVWPRLETQVARYLDHFREILEYWVQSDAKDSSEKFLISEKVKKLMVDAEVLRGQCS